MDIFNGIKLEGNAITKTRLPRMSKGQATVSYFEKTKYQLTFNVYDSEKLSKYKYARCVFMTNTSFFLLILTNDKNLKDEKYYNICLVDKTKKTIQINGSGIVSRLADQLDLSEGNHRVNIGKNISKTDDFAVFVIRRD